MVRAAVGGPEESAVGPAANLCDYGPMRRRSVACCAVLALSAGMVTATQLAPPPQTLHQDPLADSALVQEPALLSATAPDLDISSEPYSPVPLLDLVSGAAGGLAQTGPLAATGPGTGADIVLGSRAAGAPHPGGAHRPTSAATEAGDDEEDHAEGGAGGTEQGEDEAPEDYYFAPYQPLPLDGEQVPPPAPEPTQAELDDAEAGVLGTDVEDGAGSLDVLSGGEEAPEPGAERVVEVQIEVEDGLPVDAQAFGDFVMETLNDDRGWAAVEPVSFARTDDSAEFRVVLGSPDLIDEMCAPLDTAGQYSCGRNGHAALNALRWVHGAESYLDAGGELQDYRRYLVNHEVGHLLWYQHQDCPAEGEPAPIMLQQSMGLDGCEPTAWVEE